MAVLDATFRLHDARSRIGRSGSPIALPIVNKLQIKARAKWVY